MIISTEDLQFTIFDSDLVVIKSNVYKMQSPTGLAIKKKKKKSPFQKNK